MQTSVSLVDQQTEGISIDGLSANLDEKKQDTKMPVIPFIIQFPKRNLNNFTNPLPNCTMNNRRKKSSNINQGIIPARYCAPCVNQQMQCTISKKRKMNGNFKKNIINIDQRINMNGGMCYNAAYSSPFYNFYKKSRIPFTPEEDAKIKELAEKYGNRQWPLIASFLPGRTSKQCRDRYSNYLVPGFFKGEWSKEEDDLLAKLYNENGPKWSVLQKSFPGRSANSIKNRWNYFLCRQVNDDFIAEMKCKIIKDKYEASDKNENALASTNDDGSFLFQNDSKCNDSLIHATEPISDILKEGNSEAFCFIEQENEMLEILNNNIIGYENEWSIFN